MTTDHWEGALPPDDQLFDLTEMVAARGDLSSQLQAVRNSPASNLGDAAVFQQSLSFQVAVDIHIPS